MNLRAYHGVDDHHWVSVERLALPVSDSQRLNPVRDKVVERDGVEGNGDMVDKEERRVWESWHQVDGHRADSAGRHPSREASRV